MVEKLSHVAALVLSIVLIITGTAIQWKNRANLITPNDEAQNGYNWGLMVFWLIWIFCAAAFFLKQPSLAVVAAGLSLAIAISPLYAATGTVTSVTSVNPQSWAYVNYFRVSEDRTTTSATRLETVGGIFVYFGNWLSLLVAFSPYDVKAVKGKDLLLGVLTVVFFIIGSVVVWCSQAANTSSPGYLQTIDATVIAFLSTLFTVCALCNNNDLLFSAGAFISSYSLVTIFQYMGDAVFINRNAVVNGNKDPIYAGFLFLWFAMFVNIGIVASHFWKSNGSVASSQA